ncbi:Lipid-binding putative hydrolase [Dyadobacter koreensis]|uniref:Lipid-binding putative hydrolase n=1 Tax=Dyadobacter koreensis TaxID=408657 RepID=A0A1H6RIZ7_9BACT|nr:lipid-binding protein [Dyadobacter koreensis]SEI55759.1 Lipid-binding putative hydrolase [Dyadobacter koreensis]
MKYFKYISIFLVFGLLSCDAGSEPDIEGTKLQAMAGEWWINLLVDGKDQGQGFNLVTTSNTAANNDTDLLFDDHGFWPAKVVTKVNLGSMTFTAAPNLANSYDPDIKVSVIEGKILKGAATTTGGNKTDSIYVKFEFSDDAGTQYEYAGYRRTGFREDEH